MRTPAPYVVLIDMVRVETGFASTSRMGGYHSLAEAREAIASNERVCRSYKINTHTRSYRVFKAEWTEVTEDMETAA